MSMFRRVMLNLGLAADEDYDDAARAEPERSVVASKPRTVTARPSTSSMGSVRTIEPEPAVRAVPDVPDEPAVRPTSPPAAGAVRPVSAPRAKPTVLTPHRYDDAKIIGDTFKSRQPVIINLQDLRNRADIAHRLVDFSAGLAFALDGQMEKVTHNVFLLTPANMEVDDDERRRLTERGLGE